MCVLISCFAPTDLIEDRGNISGQTMPAGSDERTPLLRSGEEDVAVGVKTGVEERYGAHVTT